MAMLMHSRTDSDVHTSGTKASENLVIATSEFIDGNNNRKREETSALRPVVAILAAGLTITPAPPVRATNADINPVDLDRTTIVSKHPQGLSEKLREAVSRFEISLAEYTASVVEYDRDRKIATLKVEVGDQEYIVERSTRTIGFEVKKGDVLRLEAVKRTDGSQFFRYYRDTNVPLDEETEELLNELLDF